MKIDQNWPKIKSFPKTEFCTKKTTEVFKMTKYHNSQQKFAISGSFYEKPSKWAKSDPRLAEHS